MGFYLRKSLRAGPFRLNLSTSGVGVSAGIPGFRVGTGPRGNYVSVAGGGITYRTTLPRSAAAKGRRPLAPPSPPSLLPAEPIGDRFGDEVVMQDVTGADAAELVSTGPDDLVDQLNGAARRHRVWPWVLAITLILGVAAGVPVVIPFGVAAALWLVVWERARRTVVTFYEVHDAQAQWYELMTDGWAGLARLGGAWRIQARGNITTAHGVKTHAGASSLVQRVPAQRLLVPPAAFRTNIAVPTISVGSESLLFLPDRVLVRSGRVWSAVGYDQLGVEVGGTRFIEEGHVPGDATQVDTTWRYVNRNGTPDRRFNNNRQLPVMLYGRLELHTPTGLQWILDLSRLDSAQWVAQMLLTRRAAKPQVLAPPAQQAVSPQAFHPQPVRPLESKGGDHHNGAHALQTQPSRRARPRRQDPGVLFHYGAPAHRSRPNNHSGYLVLDIETTGLSPQQGDRIIEIAATRLDPEGRFVDEFATLVNPDGTDTGPVYVHGITNDQVLEAPTFAEIAAELLTRMEGRVVVAHNAAFEERFLLAELERLGISLRPVPALCTLWLAQHTMPTPNHRLTTIARHTGILMPDAHAALGDVRATSTLLPLMLERLGQPLHFTATPLTTDELARLATRLPVRQRRLKTRAVQLRRGTEGWMSSILARLPATAEEADSADADRYLSALTIALEDGRILGAEANQLADLVGAAGLGSAQVTELNERFLEGLRQAAFDDNILTATELTQLAAAARLLGVPGYFDDLTITPITPATTHPELTSSAPTVANPASQRRCGHCRQPGHYRTRCPELTLTS